MRVTGRTIALPKQKAADAELVQLCEDLCFLPGRILVAIEEYHRYREILREVPAMQTQFERNMSGECWMLHEYLHGDLALGHDADH